MIRRPLHWLQILVAVAFESIAAAQPDSQSSAKHLCDQGRAHYNRHEYDEAIEKCLRAYEVEHDFEFLYVPGVAYEVIGKPVEALETLDRYLREGAGHIDKVERRYVEASIARLKTRIGLLIVNVTPPNAAVWVDAIELGKSPVTRQVAVGPHVVWAELEGYQAKHQLVRVQRSATPPVTLALSPLPKPAPPPDAQGQLAIRCSLPDVNVLLDGHSAGRTPFRFPLLASEGQHTLRLERPGYHTQVTRAQVRASTATEIICDLPLDVPILRPGRLEFQVSEAGAEVLVDGRKPPPNGRLPVGLHIVGVRRYGFLPWDRRLYVEANEVNYVTARLIPTPPYLRDFQRRARARRTLSYWLGVGSIGVLGAALGLWGWNETRYSDWQALDSRLKQLVKQNIQPSPNDVRRAHDKMTAIHSVDVVTAALGIAGSLLVAAGTILYFGSEDPAQYSVPVPEAPGGSRPHGP
jgi:hypothetical protein